MRVAHADRLAWALLACALSGTSAAHAQKSPAAEDATTREARALYEEGIRHYDIAEYDAAIDRFKRAYVLTRAPELLFDIAQAQRLAGSCGAAQQSYESYLRVQPQSPKRASVESAIADMRACAKDEPAPAPAPKEPPASAPAPAPAPAPAAPIAKPEASWVPPVLGITGAALAATGGGLLVWSRVRYDALEARGCAPSCDPSDVGAPRTAQTLGGVLLVAGATVAIGGLVTWLVGARRASAAAAWLAPLGIARF